MKPAPFDYHAPRTVDDAVSLLAEFTGQGGRVIAGGQSFVPMMAFRLARPSHLIDINRIGELGRLLVVGSTLHIGATVRHAALESMVDGDTLGCLLREVARFVAHPPIRNRGTLCGSLVHADPAAEWCLVAATLDAMILARSARGVRAIAAADFFQGIMTTSLAADELVIECRIPPLADDARFGFFEVSRRAGDFAMAAALVTYRLHDGRIADPHVGLAASNHSRAACPGLKQDWPVKCPTANASARRRPLRRSASSRCRTAASTRISDGIWSAR